MNLWEVALIIVAVTYAVLNTVYMVVSLKMLSAFKPIFEKSIKMYEKMMDGMDDSL